MKKLISIFQTNFRAEVPPTDEPRKSKTTAFTANIRHHDENLLVIGVDKDPDGARLVRNLMNAYSNARLTTSNVGYKKEDELVYFHFDKMSLNERAGEYLLIFDVDEIHQNMFK